MCTAEAATVRSGEPLRVTGADAPRARTLDAHPAAADHSAPVEGGVLVLVTASGLLERLGLSWWVEQLMTVRSTRR